MEESLIVPITHAWSMIMIEEPLEPKPQKLTPKQQRFIEEYVVDFNSCQAAIRAGYSKQSARAVACETLTKPYIKKALQEKMDELTAKSQDKIVSVLQRLYETINADITNFVDDEGCYDPSNPKFNGKLVNSIRKGRSGTTVTLCSKDKALELLGRYLSMWQDKIDITTQGGAVTPVQVVFEEVGSKVEAPKE
jgi:phage terminase small subunit